VPKSVLVMNAPRGRLAPPSAPASAGNDMTSAGMPTTVQCQKPAGVGASGSKQETAKLLVPAGAPDQDSCGLMLPAAWTWASGSALPWVNPSLVTSKEAVAGSISYGSGAVGRVKSMLTTL